MASESGGNKMGKKERIAWSGREATNEGKKGAKGKRNKRIIISNSDDDNKRSFVYVGWVWNERLDGGVHNK